MPRTRPPYPPEFRREAIRLVRASEEERPIPKSGSGAGRHRLKTLRNWIKQDEIDTGEREGFTTEEREELRRLRHEVKVLRQEKEILRKEKCFMALAGPPRRHKNEAVAPLTSASLGAAKPIEKCDAGASGTPNCSL